MKTILFSCLFIIFCSYLFPVNAQINNVLVLDGCTNFFEIPDNDLLDYNQVISLECWIQPNCDDENRVVLSKQFCQGEFGYYVSVNNGRLFWSYSYSGYCTSPNNYHSVEVLIPPDVFTHIAVVHNQEEIKLFVNGLEVASEQVVGGFYPINNSSEPFRVGAYRNINGGISNYFSGLVDEVRLWNIELTASLIEQRKDIPLLGNENGLVLYLNMEELGVGSGLVLHNQSVYGTIFNALPVGYTDHSPRIIFHEQYNENIIDLGEDVSLCDETLTLNAGVDHFKYLAWNTGSTSEYLNVVNSGQYSVTVETELCKFYSDTMQVEFSESVFVSIEHVICENESITLGNNTYTQPGTFYDTVFVAMACDSIIEYVISVLPVQNSYVEIPVCPQTTIYYGGQVLEAGSTTIFELSSSNGCDSLVTVVVTPSLVLEDVLFFEVCKEETLEYNDTILYPGTSSIFTFTSVEGCDSLVTVNVEAIAAEQDFLGEDQIVCDQSFTIESPDSNTLWHDGSISSTYTTSVSGLYFGSYIDANGCMASDSIRLEFSALSIFVPNVFSPNGDGVNDCFEIFYPSGIQFEHFKWSIYNRWGGLVFETTDMLDCWEGKIKGQPATSGVYTWVLSGLARECGGNDLISGDVTLIR